MKAAKPRKELIECAKALLEVSDLTPISVLQDLIDDGYFHLSELNASPKCNSVQRDALANRIDKAEDILSRKRGHSRS